MKEIVNQIGIQDYDCYSILWYGNYIKHFEYAISKLFKDYELIQIHYSKYMNSAVWGEESEIQILDIGKSVEKFRSLEKNTRYLLCIWKSIYTGKICNSSFIEIKTDSDMIVKNELTKELEKLSLQMVASLIISVKKNNEFIVDYNSTNLLYSSMWNIVDNNKYKLNTTIVYDCFEQMRTNLFGGQKHLKGLQEKHNMAMVVGWVKNLVINTYSKKISNPIDSEFKVKITKIYQNKTFEMEEFIIIDGEIIARTLLCMVCVHWDTKNICQLPNEYVQYMTNQNK